MLKVAHELEGESDEFLLLIRLPPESMANASFPVKLSFYSLYGFPLTGVTVTRLLTNLKSVRAVEEVSAEKKMGGSSARLHLENVGYSSVEVFIDWTMQDTIGRNFDAELRLIRGA